MFRLRGMLVDYNGIWIGDGSDSSFGSARKLQYVFQNAFSHFIVLASLHLGGNVAAIDGSRAEFH